ncbi:MAG: hypothetical protein K1Y02_25265 [Candidatus Hydrogenedentes bacterium]|nr:hypothetical protein [Candidatus Hydrogenedentota bacterium]
MGEWDKLLKDLNTDGSFDAERTSELMGKLKKESGRKQKKHLISMTFYCLVGLLIMLQGALMVRDSQDIRMMLFGVIAVVIGFEITVLVKLAYGNLMTMNTVLETVRETQLSILEHLNPAQHAGQQKEV